MWLPVSGHHTMHASMRPSLALKFSAGQMSCFAGCECPSELQAWQGFDGVKASRIAPPFPNGLYQTVAVPHSQDPGAWGLYCGGAISPKYFSIALMENCLGIEQVSHLQAQNCDLSPRSQNRALVFFYNLHPAWHAVLDQLAPPLPTKPRPCSIPSRVPWP